MIIIGLLMLAADSQQSTGVSLRDVALCVVVGGAALLSALPAKPKHEAAL
jgi:hypothetical protein